MQEVACLFPFTKYYDKHIFAFPKNNYASKAHRPLFTLLIAGYTNKRKLFNLAQKQLLPCGKRRGKGKGFVACKSQSTVIDAK